MKAFEASYPAQAYDVTVESDALVVHAPTRKVRHRGDTLNQPLLTVRCSSPAPNVISVTVSHFLGEQPPRPQFPLSPDPSVQVRTELDDSYATLISGALSARFERGEGWALEFLADGRVLTASGSKAMALVSTDSGGHYVREQLSLGIGEVVYGLGERFGPLVKNGQVVDIWNADGGTSSEQAYKNVPFYLTNRGYGVFVNHPGLVSYEVGSEAVSKVQFSVAGQALEYLVIYGPTVREILRRYTALTGRPALPPAWSFGLWLSTSFTTSYDEETVTGFVDGMAARDLPLSVFHFDCFWMREFQWCDFTWDNRTFPDPAGMLSRLKDKGLRICVWINPYIAQRSPLFAEGAQHGYLLRKPNGDVWQTDQWQPGMAIVDFTNADAREWYADKLRALLDMGVDCFKTDFGERIPTDVVWSDGADPERMHNFYSYLYNQTVFELLRTQRGEQEAVVFARSATAGGQQLPRSLGRRLRVDFRIDGREPSRRSVARDVRLRVLEPRHRRLRRTSGPGGVQAVDPLRAALHPQPAARQRQLPGALAVRRGGSGGAAPVHPAEGAADAVHLRPGGDRGPRRHAGAAADGCGVSRRSNLCTPGPAVHVRGPPAGRARVFGIRGDLVLHPRRHLDAPADRRDSLRPRLGQRGVRLRHRARLRAPRNGASDRRPRRPAGLSVRRGRHAAGVRVRRRRPDHGNGACRRRARSRRPSRLPGMVAR